jgi:hypothetical protein
VICFYEVHTMTEERFRRIRKESIPDAIVRAEGLVARYETRFGLSSKAALAAVRRGEMKETAEVGRWLSAFQDLQRLREASAAGAAIGSPTRNI